MTEAEIDAALCLLQKIGNDPSGWETLYVDPNTIELWELVFPHSEMHGGGPRLLQRISEASARAKYPNLPSKPNPASK